MVQKIILWLLYPASLLALEWVTAIIGQRRKRPTWQAPYKWLVMLCWVTAVLEICFTACIALRIRFELLFSIWCYVETGAILYIQLRLLTYRWAKRMLIALLILLTLGTIVNFGWSPPLDVANIQFQLFTMFIQLVATCAALADILGNTSDVPLSAQPAFWLAAGMLFYSIVFVVMYISELLFTTHQEMAWLYLASSTIGNIFMYGGFIACFITLKKHQPHAPAGNLLPPVHDLPPGA